MIEHVRTSGNPAPKRPCPSWRARRSRSASRLAPLPGDDRLGDVELLLGDGPQPGHRANSLDVVLGRPDLLGNLLVSEPVPEQLLDLVLDRELLRCHRYHLLPAGPSGECETIG
jgi:hypothetical protein